MVDRISIEVRRVLFQFFLSLKPSILPLRDYLLAFKLAFREIRGGLKGFWIFLFCLILGVMAIAGVSSLSRSLIAGVGKEGRVLLGGDLSLRMLQRKPLTEEIQAIEALGETSHFASLRAMAVNNKGETVLIELKAVDKHYPLVGTLETSPVLKRDDMLILAHGEYGLLADLSLLTRLQVTVGDAIKIGSATFLITGQIETEPDRVGTGLGFGPRVIISEQALEKTGLIQPGSLVRWNYNILLPDRLAEEKNLEKIATDFKTKFSSAAWTSRTRMSASPGFDNGLQRFTQFLTLVGLTALLIGGIGTANAISAFVQRKQYSIAILKSIGASGTFIVTLYLFQILIIASGGILCGLVLGAALPYILVSILKGILPVPLTPILAYNELLSAALYGVLITLAFSLIPLGRVHIMTVTALFRDRVDEGELRIDPTYRNWTILISFALILMTIFSAYDKRIGGIFLIAILLCAGVLRGAGWCVMRGARWIAQFGSVRFRLAARNLYRPGSLTQSLMMSLGLSITLLVTLSLVDANISKQITTTVASKAPSYFFLDVQNSDFPSFSNLLQRLAPNSRINHAPMMMGRILSINGVPASKVSTDPHHRGILNSDRGVTFSDVIPENSKIVRGKWWPENYKGKPLVSFEEKFAQNIGLHIGDHVEISVQGLPVEVEVANFRRVNWFTLDINFFMVFSSSTFTDNAYSRVVTITLDDDKNDQLEASLAYEIAQKFPSISSIRVKEAIESANQIFGELIFAIRGASSVTLLASFLVLIGAFSTSQQTRIREAVILKTLGATRLSLMRLYLMEYCLLGCATAFVGIIAGTLISSFIVDSFMRMEFHFFLGTALPVALTIVFCALLLGLLSLWQLLNKKPASYLKEL